MIGNAINNIFAGVNVRLAPKGAPQESASLLVEALPLQVVPLALLRQGDPTAATVAVDALKRRGFCWISVEGDRLAEAAGPALAAAGAFLASEGQGTGKRHAMEGHFSAAHKDGIRVVTGDWMKQGHNSGLPESCGELVKQLAAAFDDAQLEVANVLARALFGRHDPGSRPPLMHLASTCDIPLLAPLGPSSQRYGLLDLVRYRMGPDAPEEVVAAHTDPGLFILSLPASALGLELRDEHGKWLSPPDGAGVLWVGHAGTKVGLRAGMHRVLATPDRAPRLSVWHELCTGAQLAPPLLLRLEEHGLELRYGSVRGTWDVLELLQKAEDHEPQEREPQAGDVVSLSGSGSRRPKVGRGVPDPKEVQVVQRKGVPVGKSRVTWSLQFHPVRSDEFGQVGHDMPVRRRGRSGRRPMDPGRNAINAANVAMDVDDGGSDDDTESLFAPADVVEIVRKAGDGFGAHLTGWPAPSQ